MSKTVLITGAASGMGLATAKLLSARGYDVVGADLEGGEGVTTLDVRDAASVREWVDATARSRGSIDAVITFAGYGLAGGIEETSPDEAAALLDVNVLGTARVVRAALPWLRDRGAGRIIVVSSGAAQAAQPFGGWYSASKAAIEKLGEALRMEAAPFGVDVSILTPGWTRTAILSKALKVAEPVGAYAAASAEVDRRNAGYLAGGQEPEVVAEQILRILNARKTRQNYRVGRDVRSSALARRLTPQGTYEQMIRNYYGVGRAVSTASPFAALPPMVHPSTKEPLTQTADGSLATADGAIGVKALDRDLRLYGDATAGEYEGRELPNERVRFAYRIYSKAYPIVATLVFWFVWNGNLRKLGNFYGGQIRSAATRGAAFVDIGVGDGSLTKFALNTAKVKSLPSLLFVDLSPDMLRKAAKRFRKSDSVISLVGDVTTLGIEERSTQFLGCYGALHVFPDPLAALNHMASLLTDDGELSLSILTSPGVPWKDRLITRFVATNTITTNFTIHEVEELVAKAGLEEIEKILNGHQLLLRVRRAV